MGATLRPWRESASLILLAKTSFAPPKVITDYNYKLLSIVRSAKSGFFPNTHVFPGGNISTADKSRDWLKLYEKFGFQQDAFEKLSYTDNRPLILQSNDKNSLPPFLSLRIGAIRETFEECGILICRSFKINYKERLAKWASFIESPEITKWQDRVHGDPEMFLELCRQFEIYPDVWALKDWSNWTTPATFQKRFDTIFFVAMFHQTPTVFAEKNEVERVEYNVPVDYLNRSKQGEIALPPPQFYEISRLCSFTDIDKLMKFANERAHRGLERFLPIHYNIAGSIFSILPGDDLYPTEEKEESTEPIEIAQSSDCKTWHRVRHHEPFKHEIFLKNYCPNFGHITPTVFNHDSKL